MFLEHSLHTMALLSFAVDACTVIESRCKEYMHACMRVLHLIFVLLRCVHDALGSVIQRPLDVSEKLIIKGSGTLTTQIHACLGPACTFIPPIWARTGTLQTSLFDAIYGPGIATRFRSFVSGSMHSSTLSITNPNSHRLTWVQRPGDAMMPIVALFHGLGFSGDESYLVSWPKICKEHGVSCAIFVRKQTNAYIDFPCCFNDVESHLACLTEISVDYPENPIVLVGYSSGGLHAMGLVLDKRMRVQEAMANVKGIVTVSSCFDVNNLQRKLHSDSLLDYIMGYLVGNKGEPYTKHYMYNAHNPVYNEMSLLKRVKDVPIPCVLIHSLDDPFYDVVFEHSVLEKTCVDNANICIITSKTGGHVSWITNKYDSLLDILLPKVIMQLLAL